MTVKTRIAKNPPEIKNNELPMLLDEKTTAKLLGVSLSYLRKSRCEGEKDPEKICGGNNDNENPAPPFVRLNKQTVRYPRDDLFRWVENLSRRKVI